MLVVTIQCVGPDHYLPRFSDSPDSCQPWERRGRRLGKWLVVWACLLKLLGHSVKTFLYFPLGYSCRSEIFFAFSVLFLGGETLIGKRMKCIQFTTFDHFLFVFFDWWLVGFLCCSMLHCDESIPLVDSSSSGWKTEGRPVSLLSSVTRNLVAHLGVCV